MGSSDCDTACFLVLLRLVLQRYGTPRRNAGFVRGDADFLRHSDIRAGRALSAAADQGLNRVAAGLACICAVADFYRSRLGKRTDKTIRPAACVGWFVSAAASQSIRDAWGRFAACWRGDLGFQLH